MQLKYLATVTDTSRKAYALWPALEYMKNRYCYMLFMYDSEHLKVEYTTDEPVSASNPNNHKCKYFCSLFNE